LLSLSKEHLHQGRLELTGSHLRLTEKSLMISDDIMSDLMTASA